MTPQDPKTVIITGGTKGIGAAIAREFYKAGMHVIVGSRSDNGFPGKLGPRARYSKMDVTREIDHNKIAQTALKWTQRLDVYVNCAGFSQWKPAEKVDERFWDEMISVNLKGTFWGCKIAGKYLVKNGCIINVSSLAGKRGSTNNSVYCASKFGVSGLTQALAKEFGPRGVRVNAVCPVYVETQGLLKALTDENSPAQGKNIQRYLKEFAKTQSALGRLPTAEEVARVCLFLASDAASAITGQSLNVDCGVFPQ